MPAAFARFGLTPSINVEGFYQFAFQRSETAGCGTFFAVTDYIADRCDKIMLGPTLNDRQSLALGAYAKRAPDQDVSDVGQFGAGVTYKAEAIATQFGAYFAQYHSRSPFVDAIRAGRPVPLILGDPDGLNPRYFIEHHEFLSMLATENLNRASYLKKSRRIRELHSPLLGMISTLLERGAAVGAFRKGVDPVQLYISIAALGFFYLSNRYTLSTIFGRDFFARDELAARSQHVLDVVLGYLEP